MITTFIKDFCMQNGNFEFVLSNSGVYKVLFWSRGNNNDYIIKYLFQHAFIPDQCRAKMLLLSKYFKSDPFHIGYDDLKKRFKIYIPLYHHDFHTNLKKISTVQRIFNVKKQYFLEENFLKFDCIGIDIFDDISDIKIYEIIKQDKNTPILPSILGIEDIKEAGYLKSFSGRKKRFFRLLGYRDISSFSSEFQLSYLEDFQQIIKEFYFLQKKVKYYCEEGGNKEIYLI